MRGVFDREDEGALKVFYLGGHSQAGFVNMRKGEYATFDSPYVCARGDAEVRLLDVELDPPGSGIEVTDAGVTHRRLSNVDGWTARERLRDLPQEVDLTYDGTITESCSDTEKGHSQTVWLELHKARAGTLTVERSRYVYAVDGEVRVTEWIPGATGSGTARSRQLEVVASRQCDYGRPARPSSR